MIELVTLVVIALIATFIYFSSKSGNRLFVWLGRLIPPFLLLGLIKVPVDIFTSLVWLSAGCVMLYSLLKTILSLLESIYWARHQDKLEARKSIGQSVRPLLCVVCYFTASYFVSQSVYSANGKALELAQEMHAFVQLNGTCDSKRPDWAEARKSDPEYIGMRYGEYGTKYTISYKCDPELEKFSYVVRINQDEDFRIVGKFDGNMDVTFGDYGAPTRVTLSDTLDLAALVKMRIRYSEDL